MVGQRNLKNTNFDLQKGIKVGKCPTSSDSRFININFENINLVNERTEWIARKKEKVQKGNDSRT